MKRPRTDCPYCGEPDPEACGCAEQPEQTDRCVMCGAEVPLSQLRKHLRGCGVMA